MESYNCEATSVDVVHNWLTQEARIDGKWILLVDIRGNVAFQKSHVKFAVNLRLSTLLLRRILRGTAAVENFCPDTIKYVVEYRKQLDCCVVLYDESSTRQHPHKDVLLYAEMLQPSTANKILYIDGGFEEFHKRYSHHCEGTGILPVTPSMLGRNMKKLNLLCKHERGDTTDVSRSPTQILPFLYIGNNQNAADKLLLKQLGVTAILNVSNSTPPDHEGSFDYKQISVLDNHQADLLSHLNSAIEFIDSVKNKDGCILVHSMAGISRSATVCIAFLMKYMDWDLQKTFKFLKAKRSCVDPNLGFMGQLVALQQQLHTNPPSSEHNAHQKSEINFPPSNEQTKTSSDSNI